MMMMFKIPVPRDRHQMMNRVAAKGQRQRLMQMIDDGSCEFKCSECDQVFKRKVCMHDRYDKKQSDNVYFRLPGENTKRSIFTEE